MLWVTEKKKWFVRSSQDKGGLSLSLETQAPATGLLLRKAGLTVPAPAGRSAPPTQGSLMEHGVEHGVFPSSRTRLLPPALQDGILGLLQTRKKCSVAKTSQGAIETLSLKPLCVCVVSF